MLYLALTLLFASIGIFTFLPKLQDTIEKHSVGVNFFLTLIATLIGVLLAIMITDYEADQKEKQDLIKLAHAAIASCETSLDYSRELVDFCHGLADEDETKTKFYTNNPLPYPEYLEVFTSQNIVSRNISEETFLELSEMLINLKRTQGTKVDTYIKLLELSVEMLKFEVLYQQGAIDSAQLDMQIEQLKQVTWANIPSEL